MIEKQKYLIYLTIFLYVFYNEAFANTITFDNFSNRIQLHQQGEYYLNKKTGQKIILSNRLIIKLDNSSTTIKPQHSKNQLLNYHPQIISQTTLYIGDTYTYYSVEIKDIEQLANVLTYFQQQPSISLVQPDILQIKRNTNLVLSNQPKNNSLKKSELIKAKQSAYLSILDIADYWPYSKGKGVKVAIIDDGFNFEHPDLQNVNTLFSYDVENKILNATANKHTDKHGTKVMGIIFAEHNQIGIDGIAPEADFIAIKQPDSWTSNTLLSFYLSALAGADIINCSWHSQWLLQPIAEIINDLSVNGRKGKGLGVVFSAGNNGKEINNSSHEAAINSAIVVGANNKQGKILPFSNYGKSVDFFAFGGKVKTTVVSGKYGIFSGTSLSAAIVSGIAALKLSQQPDLTLAQLTSSLKAIKNLNKQSEQHDKK